MPQGGIEALTSKDPLAIKAFQYDMVCNGFEIASGGIRNHLPETMVKAFEIVGLSRETVEERFGGLYRAFQYGAPPHGGMAAGIDRIVMLLVGAKNLREVTMFPMNQQAYGPVDGRAVGGHAARSCASCICASCSRNPSRHPLPGEHASGIEAQTMPERPSIRIEQRKSPTAACPFASECARRI